VVLVVVPDGLVVAAARVPLVKETVVLRPVARITEVEAEGARDLPEPLEQAEVREGLAFHLR